MISKPEKNKKAAESQAADAVTIAWMLATFATLVGEVAVVATWLLAVVMKQPGEKFQPLTTFPGLLLFITFVTGIVCLVLTPVAQSMRSVKAPVSIMVFAISVGCSPIATLVFFVLIS